MSRSGYSDDCDNHWQWIQWRGRVASAMRGKRGQAFLQEMLEAMASLPVRKLIKDELEATDRVSFSHWGLIEADSVCAIGAVGKARGIDMTALDPEDYAGVAATFNIPEVLAQEIVYMNDEAGRYKETPEERFERMRRWIENSLYAGPAHSSTMCQEGSK